MTYAEGGTISYANGKRIHTFEDSGQLVVTEAGTVEALVVAGGGAGGGDYSATGTAFGGGGGGGVIYTSALTVGLGNVAVTIGEGGLSVLSSGGTATDAQNSVITDGGVNFTTQTAIKGGTFAQNGGSGGGGSGGGFGNGGTGTVGQGNDGGDVTNFFTGSAGGGGAAAAGSDAPASDFTDTAGAGGAGYLSSISGTATRYGAGGGGGAWKEGYGIGGLGGGGDGGSASADGTTQYQSGLPGTGYGAGGGGQGGQWGAARSGGPGHKGVVIFSYDSDFTTGRRVAENEDLADMTASTIKGRITTTGIPQDLTAAQVAGILDTEITERAQDAVGAMVADTATIDLTYTDATPELKADVRVDSINDTHIDWGTGANQVNLDDVPDGSTYVKITATNHTDLTDGGNTTLHAHGIYGLLSGTLAQFAATTSLELKGVISDETGTGALVFGTSPTLTAPVIGNFFYANHTHAASGVTGGTLASATGLPLTTGVTGILPAANGGTGIDNSTRTLTISANAGTISFSAAASTLTVPATGTAALLATANVFTANQSIHSASTPQLLFAISGDANSYSYIRENSATTLIINKTSQTGQALIDVNPTPSDGTSAAGFRFFRLTNTSGAVSFDVHKGNNTATINCSFSGNGSSYVAFDSGNFGIGTNTYGTSAVKVLGIKNGTEPTTSPADTLQIYAVDLSAGNSTLGLRTETGVVTESVTSDRTLSVKINGTTYKICLKA